MSGAWGEMVAAEAALDTVWADHGYAIEKLNDHGAKHHGAFTHSVMWDRGYRDGARQTIAYILGHQNRHFDDLTVSELIGELRKGEGSIYWPLKSADPTFSHLCDHCRTNQLFDASGLCPNCGDDASEA